MGQPPEPLMNTPLIGLEDDIMPLYIQFIDTTTLHYKSKLQTNRFLDRVFPPYLATVS